MARRSAPSESFIIRRPEQASALVSPVRQEIVDAVAAAGACTMAEIGAWLGRRADTLYYHLAALVRVGLLIETGRVRTGRRFGAVYDVPGRPLRLVYGGAIGAEAITRIVGAALRLGDRDFRRSFDAEGTVTEGPGRNLWGGRAKGWVNAADLAEINGLIARLTTLVQQGKPREGGKPLSFTYVITPSGPGGRKGAKASSRGSRKAPAAGTKRHTKGGRT